MNSPVKGWRDRVFEAAVFFFVVVFVAFILTLLVADALYIDKKAVITVLTSRFITHALWMSIWTSFSTTFISLLFAVPVGYALSRLRFPGRILADAIVDLPIVFPPLVVGLTLLVFFSQTCGRDFEQTPIFCDCSPGKARDAGLGKFIFNLVVAERF